MPTIYDKIEGNSNSKKLIEETSTAAEISAKIPRFQWGKKLIWKRIFLKRKRVLDPVQLEIRAAEHVEWPDDGADVSPSEQQVITYM